MNPECGWCGIETEDFAFTMPQGERITETDYRGFERWPPGEDHQIKVSPIPVKGESPGKLTLCRQCEVRLFSQGSEFFGSIETMIDASDPSERYDNFSMVREIIRLIDILNSEPKGRDWEETFP